MPREAARPTPAVTWKLLIPEMPYMLVPEPIPLPMAIPHDWIWLPKRLAAGLIDCMNEPADIPNVDIDATEPVPDAKLIPEESAVGNEAAVAHDAAGDVDDDVDVIVDVAVASPGTMLYAAVPSWPDNIEPSSLVITVLSWLDITELS